VDHGGGGERSSYQLGITLLRRRRDKELADDGRRTRQRLTNRLRSLGQEGVVLLAERSFEQPAGSLDPR
jgi:hypothetical protein